jgi:hypothetical protein
MSAPIVSNSGSGLGDLANLLKVIASPELFGSGKTTESSTSSASPEATKSANDLLAQISGSVNPADIDNMIQNILVRAKQAFGPAAIGANAAGIRAYSDTTENSLRDEAMARAVAESAQAKLTALNNANATAAKVVDTKMQTSRAVQSTRQTARSPVGTGLLVALGAGALAKRLPKLSGADQTGVTDTGIDNSSYTPNEFGAENVANFPGDAGQNLVAGAAAAPIVNDVGESIFTGDLPIDSALDIVPTEIGAAADTSIPDSSQVDNSDFVGDIPVDEGAGAATETLAADTGGNVIEDLFGDFGFGDGGVVDLQGRRAPPGAYAPGVLLPTGTKPSSTIAPSSTINASPITSVLLPSPAAGKGKTRSNVAVDEQGNVVAGDSGMAAGSAPSGGSIGSFSLGSPSATGMALAGLNAAAGNIAGAVMSLTMSALANSSTDPTTADDPNSGLAGLAGAAGLAGESGLTGLSAEADASLAGFMGAEMGFSPSGNTEASSPDASSTSGDFASTGDFAAGGGFDSGDADGGGGDSGGGGGDSGGGGEADGGIIQGEDAEDYSGLDRVMIHVTPGEAVLPVDTVNALGGQSVIDKLIAATHTPIKKRRK